MRTPHFLTTLLVFSSLASSSYAGPDCPSCVTRTHASASTSSSARITARPEASPAFGGKVRTSNVNVEGGEKRQVKSVGNTILPSSYDSKEEDGAKAQMWAEEKNDTLAQGEFKTPSGFHGDLYRSDDGSWKIKDPEGGTLRSLGVDKQGNLYVLRHEGKERKFEKLKPEQATAIKKQITAALEKAKGNQPAEAALTSLSKKANPENPEPANAEPRVPPTGEVAKLLRLNPVDADKPALHAALKELAGRFDTGWFGVNDGDAQKFYEHLLDQGIESRLAVEWARIGMGLRANDKAKISISPRK